MNNEDMLQIEYTPFDVYKFAEDGDGDNLRKALNNERNCNDWYITADGYEDDEIDDFGELKRANALIAASLYDNFECISILLDKGIDIESVNANGSTALVVAAWHGSFQSMKLLIERGASIERKTSRVESICECAANQGHADCLQLLIDNGANWDSRSEYGYSPWHIAAENGHLDCMKVLLNTGVNINSTMADGKTALHQCIHEELVECVKFLLNNGACMNKRENDFNFTPIDFAIRYQNTSVLGIVAEAIETSTRKFFLKKFIRNHIYYKPSYEKSINSLLQYSIVDAPPGSLSQVEGTITNSYLNEVFFELHLHVAATSYKQRSKRIHKSPILSSECRDDFASNSNDTSTLMVVLSSYLKEYLQPNFNSHCYNCNRGPMTTFRCSVCKRVTYCHRSCQRESWKLHRYNCC